MGDDLGLSNTTGSGHHSSTASTGKEADLETLFNHKYDDESQAKALEQNGQEIWTGMLSPGMCKAEDTRKLATDGRLNDEIVNIVHVLGDHEDVKEYLLPTFVMELVREARYKDLDTWAAKTPKQAKP
ncbi:hypothetical protein LTR86_011142 [Recurvomyces mirabilis]|nr:hypothetical protein LTR86_011142 [Recurvomyces mirabilis]